MKKRITVKLQTITTRDEAEAVMTELAQSANNQRAITAERDALVLTINERYESNLGACAEAIKEKTDILRAWAEATPDAFPKDHKSIQFTSGKLGFRTGTPKLSLLSRAFNWDKVLSLLRSTGWRIFIRNQPEVDKEAILGMCRKMKNAERLAKTLSRRGLKVAQDETFFIEPDLTQFDTRQVTTMKEGA